MLKLLKTSIAFKISAMIVLMFLLLSSTIILISLYHYQQNVVDSYATSATDIAETVVTFIDGDKYEQLAQSFTGNDYWHELKEKLNKVKADADCQYLYAMDAGSKGSSRYVVEGTIPGESNAGIGTLGDPAEDDAFGEEMFDSLASGKSTKTGIYESVGFGTMVSGFAPIFNSKGKVVGVLGADVSVNAVMGSIKQFSASVILLSIIVLLFFSLLMLKYINVRIGKPIKKLSLVSDKISIGDIDVNIDHIHGEDEIAILNKSFKKLLDTTVIQVDALERIAVGDFTGEIQLRSDKDYINSSIRMILTKNIRLIHNISDAASQVSAASGQVASNAQNLANGSTNQTEALQNLTDAVTKVKDQAEQNASYAVTTSTNATMAEELMSQSMEYMHEMTDAMSAINASSQNIAKVIKVIDDIAFQTNILALNAAVEAARAGQHGKGFAVVADEVRNLASKSAAAAKETEVLIENSIRSVKTGGDVVDKTNESLMKVVEISADNMENMTLLRDSSSSQSEALSDITAGIDSISDVVTSNTAFAEEGAASAQEMSAQANMLEQIVSQFKVPALSPFELHGAAPALQSEVHVQAQNTAPVQEHGKAPVPGSKGRIQKQSKAPVPKPDILLDDEDDSAFSLT